MKLAVPLGDIVSFKTGKLDSNAASPEGAFPFFTCSQKTLQTDTHSFDCECVLLAGNNATGTFPLKYFQGKFDAYQRTYILQPRSGAVLDARFLYYSLQLKLELMKSLSTGAATKFLTLGILRTIKIGLPPVVTQKKIASLLAAYDDLIEVDRRRVQLLEDTATRIFREWFVDFRYPGHGTSPSVPSSVGKIPRGWQVAPLAALARLTLGGTPARDVPGYWGGSVPWLRSGALNQCPVVRPTEFITEMGLANSAAKLLKRGAVLVAITGAILISRLEIDAAANQSVVGIDQCTSISEHYLFEYLKANQWRLEGMMSGSAQQHINKQLLGELPVLVPAPTVGETYVRIVQPIYEQIRCLHLQIECLGAARDSLLPNLISGHIDVENLDIDTSDIAA